MVDSSRTEESAKVMAHTERRAAEMMARMAEAQAAQE